MSYDLLRKVVRGDGEVSSGYANRISAVQAVVKGEPLRRQRRSSKRG